MYTSQQQDQDQDLEISYMPSYYQYMSGGVAHEKLRGYSWHCVACGVVGSISIRKSDANDGETERRCLQSMRNHALTAHGVTISR